MKKRIEHLEEQLPDNSRERLRELYQRWKAGADVTNDLEVIFRRHPDWKHKPPLGIGKVAYIDWTCWTGHEMITEKMRGRCQCGYEIE